MAHETLESLLSLICKSVTVSQQNAQQTLYTLGDAKDAKLAYDLIATCNMEVKFFADQDHGKLYVQNASARNAEAKLGAVLVSSAPVLKQIKDLLDSHASAAYNLALTTTPTGRQLTITFPSEKPAANAQPAGQSQQKPATTAKQPEYKTSKKYDQKPEEETIATGPAVARKSIPKSLKTSDSADEDPLLKRIFLYLSGRAFSGFAWVLFVVFILAIIFTLIVTVRGFLCPDVATDVRTIPAYCPKKLAPRAEQ